jgi:threonine dehydrogenase-like Zn-dependent dehydrogenase
VAIAATQPLTVDSDGPRPSAAERATIAVIGAGTMGRGLVQLAAATGPWCCSTAMPTRWSRRSR